MEQEGSEDTVAAIDPDKRFRQRDRIADFYANEFNRNEQDNLKPKADAPLQTLEGERHNHQLAHFHLQTLDLLQDQPAIDFHFSS
jgi:hypothetical protein